MNKSKCVYLFVALIAVLVVPLRAYSADPVPIPGPTNPLSRTPLHIHLCDGCTDYTVPKDKLLVIETMFLAIACDHAANSGAVSVEGGLELTVLNGAPIPLLIPVQRQQDLAMLTTFAGIETGRVTLRAGSKLQSVVGSELCSSAHVALDVFGYLVGAAATTP